MRSVTEIADAIIAREGGYVNDPDDPGGATNFGVTIHTMRGLGMDLTGDGKVTPKDVRRLSREQARDILVTRYFHAPRIARLPVEIQAQVFDMYVNAGRGAVRILQRLLGNMGHAVTVDGVIGAQTALASQKAQAQAPDYFADAYAIERRNFYYRLADKRPASRKYARRNDGGKGGWILRAEALMSEKYHLSDAQHRERVAAWA